MHEVYRAYDADGLLLYIGSCMDVDRRWDTHKGTAFWRPFCFKLVTKCYPNKAVARTVEARAISILSPLFNSQHNRNRLSFMAEQRYRKRAKVRPSGRPETVRRWRRDGFPGLVE